MIKKGRKIAVSLLGILSTLCIAGGVSACKNKSNPMMAPDEATTIRIVTPNDGSLPTAHTALENVGYMAYTLDNQAYYHAYANNSTKAMGYEQITQTWKDYKSAALTGIGESVMIGSDISYSTLSKSVVQTCSISNREAYVRGGSKPGKNTTSTTAGWSTDAPAYYDKDAYFHKYGEFSTELCVYVINEYTIADSSEVTVKEDGTYEQTYYLNEQAGCWYQYKMKTNGGLKKYPKFEHVAITFNFDSNWRVLSSYCEEKIEITPGALGGIPATSNSKTTTTFYYGESEFDNVHYGYFDDYFKQYLGTKPGTSNTGEEDEPSVMDILGNGFGKVMGEGQQFNLNLTLGDTEYVGKVYAKLEDLSNVLNTLDVRVALEKKGSGKQDLFIGFKEGAVNVYYSDDFALNVNIGSIGTVVNQFKDWIKIFAAPESVSAAGYSLVDDEEEKSDGLGELLAQLKLDLTDDAAYISLTTDNLMGTGIGANLNLDFNRTKDEEGSTFSFRNLDLNSITYDSTSIKLSASILPDDANSAPISRDEKSTAADLADYANSVYNMLNSDTLKVDLTLDGNGEGVLSVLEGVDVSLTAYLKLGNELSLKTDISAAFGEVSAKLSAYYGINLSNGGYGVVYLNLTEVNGNKMDAKVRCNIDETVTAVKQLISSISGAQAQATAVTYAESDADGLAQIINKALCLDFGKVLKDIYASNSQIRLGIDVDEVIAGLGLDVNGLKFGTAALALNNGEKASFNLNLPKLGFTASVSGSTEAVAQPDENGYLNVIEIVNLVKTAADEAQEIIDAKDIAFNIDATLIIDDIPLSVKGSGEVVWVDGNIKVAVDVTLAVADGTSEAAKNDALALKLLFDPSAEDGSPIAKFAVNSLGMEIYQSDLDETKAGLENIINSVKALLDGNKTGNATPEEAVALLNTAYNTQSSNNVADDIITIIKSGNVQTILKTVLNFVSGLTSFDLQYNAAEEVSGFIIRHAVNGNVKLATNGNLAIALEVNNDNGTRIVEGSADVAVGNGDAFTALEAEFARKVTVDGNEVNAYTFTNAAEAEKAFVKVAYDYLFAVIENMSIADVLDGRTYTVQVNLDGAKSAIPALQNITVDASIYYTEGLDGDKIVESKLAEIDVVLNINGVAVSFNARYNAGYIFIDLRNIDNLSFTDIKVRADVQDIYSVCEQVIDIITSKAIADLIAGNANAGAGSEEAVAMLSLAKEGETKTSVTGVLAKLFTLNFSEAFSYKKVSGVNTATIQTDYILNQLGFAPEYNIGVITVGIDPESHKIEADIDLDGNKWLTASAEAATRREEYVAGWQSKYIDISFVSTLLSDISKTVISGDTINTMYTFKGNINVNVVVAGDIPLENVVLSVGLRDGAPYVSFTATLTNDSITKAMDISVTYSNGYITMGREDDNGNRIYKVMTLEYLLDNIFDYTKTGLLSYSSNSPLRWLLGMSENLWGMIFSNFSINVDSGLTKTKNFYLYEQLTEAKQDKEDATISLSDYINALAVNSNGKMAEYGNTSNVLTNLKLDDTHEYYAFDVNPEFIGTVTTLQAAILRDGVNGGLSGLRAYAAIQSYLKVNITLDELSTAPEDVAADYFNEVTSFDKNHAFTEVKEHMSPVFGCYSTETDTYEASWIRERFTLTVMDGDEAVYVLEDIPFESTVYLTSPFSPNWTDSNKTAVYGYRTDSVADLGRSVIVTGNLTVYPIAIAANPVTVHIGRGDIDTIEGALSIGEQIPVSPYKFKDLTFAGWYSDAQLSQKVETYYAGLTDIYAAYITTLYVADNGVKYEYDINGYYVVAGLDVAKAAEKGNDYEKGDVLIIADYIDDIRVKEIKASAFKSSETGINLKNVVVPETVDTVGAQAFMDNLGMQSAVFLADKVFFGGNSWDGDTRYVFFGCSTKNDGTDTVLNLYYNIAESEGSSYENSIGGDTAWMGFRRKGSGIAFVDPYKPYYVGDNGGSRNGARVNEKNERVYEGVNWAYVNYKFEVDGLTRGITCLEYGIVTAAMSAEEIVSAVTAELNGRTASEYINGYTVTASGGYALDGKMHDITVTITENKDTERRYKLDLTVTSDVGVIATGDVEKFGDATYAKAKSTVTLKPAIDGNKVALTSGNVEYTEDGDNVKFTMPCSTLSVTAGCTKNAVEEVTILSAIPYSYDGYTVNLSDGLYRCTVTGVEEGKTELADPVSSGYTFIGYAYADGETLVFTSSVVTCTTLYAVWAENRDEVTYSETHITSGSAVPANDFVTVNATGFAGWYTDTTFANQVTTLTTSTTVLHARLQYSLNLTFSFSNSTFFWANNSGTNSDGNNLTYSAYDGKFGNGSNNKTADYPLTVNEGSNVKLSVDSSKVVLTITMTDVDGTVSYWSVRGYKGTSGFNGLSTKRNFMNGGSSIATYTSGVWYDNSNVSNKVTNDVATTTCANSTVNGNLAITLGV